ncbi:MAG: amino acid permease [Gemmatimonas sp.]|nr:amino acid permease [Gemmatimonas sp.]
MALVIANIIGAGIFTTTGFQAADLGHPLYIFALWIVGGALALIGALCYAELGAMMPYAGGEYVYLRETYGSAAGFMSAFVSLVAGFSAPIAAASKSFVFYLGYFIPGLAIEEPVVWGLGAVDLTALFVVWGLVAIHARGVRVGVGFIDWMTLFKVAGIVLVILAAIFVGTGDVSNFSRVSASFYEMGRFDVLAAFGTSLIFVMFCFSGWNAAAYVAGEMENPQRHLPRALLIGTGIVLLLYLGLNAVYFLGASADQLAGQVEVGLVASRTLFGTRGVGLVTIVLCVSILASASAMTMAGPRVYYALGRDFTAFAPLSRTRADGAPGIALLVQGIVTSVILVSGRVDQIQQYAGFTLSLFAAFAVSCVIVLRVRRPDLQRPFRAWGYPWTPAIFLGVSVWMMFWALQGRPLESLLGLGTVLVGGLIFAVTAVRRQADTARPNQGR